MAKQAQTQEGSVTTRILEGSIIETVYRGYMTLPMMEEVLVSLEKLLVRVDNADWLIDTTQSTGFAVAPPELMRRILDTFRGRGGRRIAAIVGGGGLRMLAATFSFALQLPLKTFDSRTSALAYLRT